MAGSTSSTTVATLARHGLLTVLALAILCWTASLASAVPINKVTPSQIKAFLGGRTGKLVYGDLDDSEKMYWIDLSTMVHRKISGETNVRSPLISPDGTRVVYNLRNIVSRAWPESQNNTGDVFVRPLSGGSRGHVCCTAADQQAFEARWWLKPGSNEEYIVYPDYWEADDHSRTGRHTWKQRIKPDGTPEGSRIKILNHAFEGGLSLDGKVVGDAMAKLHMAYTMDLGGGDGWKITPDLKPADQKSACNPSMSPDNRYWILHLERKHHRCLVRNMKGVIQRVINQPAGSDQVGYPEYSTDPRFVTYTAQFGGKHHLYIANITTSDVSVLKIAEGNFAFPHLWVAPREPNLSLSPRSLSFSATEGEAGPTATKVQVSNSGEGTLDGVVLHEAQNLAHHNQWDMVRDFVQKAKAK
jgi:hypothetical protein